MHRDGSFVGLPRQQGTKRKADALENVAVVGGSSILEY